jgi:hypothetical protein
LKLEDTCRVSSKLHQHVYAGTKALDKPELIMFQNAYESIHRAKLVLRHISAPTALRWALERETQVMFGVTDTL